MANGIGRALGYHVALKVTLTLLPLNLCCSFYSATLLPELIRPLSGLKRQALYSDFWILVQAWKPWQFPLCPYTQCVTWCGHECFS